MTLFLRVLDTAADEKHLALLHEVAAVRCGKTVRRRDVFDKDPVSFVKVPGTPFAYWAPAKLLQIFFTLSPLHRKPRSVVSTNPLNADFRYVRVWWEPAQESLGYSWQPWAKGGAFSPHYYDVDTVIAWSCNRRTYNGFIGTANRPLERPASVQYFFRPGLTWPRRTQGGFGLRAMPAGCIFADKGPAAFVDDDSTDDLLAWLAVTSSGAFRDLVQIQMTFGSYEVGVIQRTPVPDLSDSDIVRLSGLARRIWSLKRSLDTSNETSHAFVLPAGLNEKIIGLDRLEALRELVAIQNEIDEAAFQLYGILPEDRAAIETSLNRDVAKDGTSHESDDEDDVITSAAAGAVDATVSWLMGVAFVRFDPRLATGERAIPQEPEPFDPLPARSPGMWPEGEEPADRPDILVDDEGHRDDLIARVMNVAERVGLEVRPDLRHWLAREFFPLHIRMYSKSRRKAPIYWQLATPSASYSVWLYIHAFTKDTFFRVQNDYVAPKLAHEERRLETMLGERDKATAQERKELARQEAFVEELRAFLDEIKRVAPLWNPDLDDGVIINFAPLWRLVPHHKPWQKELKATWDALREGKYDWAHLAMHFWPERVVPKCAADRSLAIAHGLEEVFWVEGSNGKWTARQTPMRPIEELVEERTSSAVKAALRSLLEAPSATGIGRKTKKGKANA